MIDASRNSGMSRRSGTSVQVLVATAIVGFFIYLLYTHHDLQTRLKKSDEKAERLHQQHDSLSAQLQVVYEHKARLEKSLQQEKGDHRKTRTDLLQQQSGQEAKFLSDKQELLNRINSITQELKMLKSQHEDTQIELTKLNEQKIKEGEDHGKLLEQHNLEFQQLKQEKDNEIAQLRDQVANFQRKNEDVENRLAVAQQNNQINQAQLQRQNLLLQNQQKQQLNQQNQGGGQPDQNPLPGNQFNNNILQQNQLNQQLQQKNNLLYQQQQQQQQVQQQDQKLQPLVQEHHPDINQNQLGLGGFGKHQGAPDSLNNGVQVQDMAVQHQNQGIQNQGGPQQHMQQNQQLQQQQQQEPDAQHEQMRLDQKNQKQPETGNDGQFKFNNQQNQVVGEANQDNVAMQIKQPGDNQHPGYHQIKEAEENKGHARVKIEEIHDDGGGQADKADEEHKDVQFQQVQAPNMSPEKNKTRKGLLLNHLRQAAMNRGPGLNDTSQDKQEQAKKNQGQIIPGHFQEQHDNSIDKVEGQALAVNAPEQAKNMGRIENEEMGVKAVVADENSKTKEENKAMEENDEEDNADKDGGMDAQLRPNRMGDGAGFEQGRPLENQQQGPMGGLGFGHDAIQAPAFPQMLPRPDEVAPDNNPGAGAGGDGDGQVERPNIMPPMVNNMPEDQVPKAPRLKDNDILNRGQNVVDDGDDYGNNNDNQAQQDDQEEEDDKDDDNYPGDKAK